MNEETILTLKYIAAWNWHIIAVILLSTTLIASMLSHYIFIIGCAIGTSFAEFMALRRQKESYGTN